MRPSLYCRLVRMPRRIYQVYKDPTWLVTARPPNTRAEPIKHEARRMGKLAHPLDPKTTQLLTYNYSMAASTAVLHIYPK